MVSIHYGKQLIDRADIEEVTRVLKSNWVTQGPKIREFEEAIATYCGARYAVAVSSGTAALHLACLVAGLGPGDEAITSPVTFLATANSVVYTGARPIFSDINYDTANIDPGRIKGKIGKRTKAVLPVHLAGLPADMVEISSLAKKNNLMIIEDASHALGAEYQGEKIGSCKYSDMAVFSFHPVKHITTGEGGCITTNSKRLRDKLLALRSHGVYRSEGLQKRLGGWFYEMRDLGFNYRITDIQCVLGLSQLKKLDRFLKNRALIAERYDHAFLSLEAQVKLPALKYKDRKHAWHLYLFRLRLNQLKLTRRRFYDLIKSKGINAQVHYIPLYRQPFYKTLLGNGRMDWPLSERYYEEVISLPIYPSLSEKEQNRVVQVVKKIIIHHTR